MNKNFEINIDKIGGLAKVTNKEKNYRIKNLELFNATGFPNKRLEDWKFSDFNEIVNNNFEKLDAKKTKSNFNKINFVKDFEHNYILLINGNLHSSNFEHEEKNKIKISPNDKSVTYQISKNPLVCLNHALARNGYFLEIKKNYKFKKTLVVYNFFTKDIKNKILNNKNKILVKENSEIHIIEYNISDSKFKFINNLYENIILEKNATLKNLCIQSNDSGGFFYKFLKNKFSFNSDYSNFIFSSGLKFNKLDIECDLVEKNSRCKVLSALFLKENEHQEIKTRINHLAPNCQSYQKIKKVLKSESKGVFQGKIYVKDVAQKTNAYQLSKALLLDNNSEFNSKPELEIYADDVKCSHGSSSGSVDDDSLYYLMSRGLDKNEATKLLIKGFLNDIIEFIKSKSIRKFVESKLEEQINEY